MKPERWLGITLALTLMTYLSVYIIPADYSPLNVIRYVLGFGFVAFLPGYCLINILFLGKNRLDLIESLVLSVALSLGLAGLIGLFLGLSPIGINFDSITVSLGVAVIALALVGYVRRIREKDSPVLQVQSPQ